MNNIWTFKYNDNLSPFLSYTYPFIPSSPTPLPFPDTGLLITIHYNSTDLCKGHCKLNQITGQSHMIYSVEWLYINTTVANTIHKKNKNTCVYIIIHHIRVFKYHTICNYYYYANRHLPKHHIHSNSVHTHYQQQIFELCLRFISDVRRVLLRFHRWCS